MIDTDQKLMDLLDEVATLRDKVDAFIHSCEPSPSRGAAKQIKAGLDRIFDDAVEWMDI